MKKSMTISALLMVGSSATGVSATNLPSTYFGSDTLFNVTRTAITDVGTIGPASAYVGGGSGGGASAMAAGGATTANSKQQTAPMSRMIKKDGNTCTTFNGGAAAGGAANASGIVIGLDAVDILSSTQTGGQSSGSTCNATGEGLNYNSLPAGVFQNTGGDANKMTWKWILALIYGGKDLSTCTNGASCATQDCTLAGRTTLVANWSSLFEGGCSPSTTAGGTSGASGNSICKSTAINGALWHAYRRDDTSGTSDVFASLLGLAPSTSNSSLNGFGASPYCNAMNWDNTSGNTTCGLGAHDQFQGPGGIPDASSTSGYCADYTFCNASTPCATGNGPCTPHRAPPANVWGNTPSGGNTAAYDVLPTQMQDNDPIRHTCQGVGTVSNHARPGEEVCNADGTLGLVLPITDTDWILQSAAPNNLQYPTTTCTGFVSGKPMNVFTCAPRFASKHTGECPDTSAVLAGTCQVPTTATTSLCANGKTQFSLALSARTLTNPDGRVYNLALRDGSVTALSIGYAQYPVNSISSTLDFVGAFSRIHEMETLVGPGAAGCQLQDMTDQLGCLAAADPCSISFAGDEGRSWSLRTNNGPAGTDNAVGNFFWDVAGLQVAKVAPGQAAVQLLGKTGEYQASRKLYFNSLLGFGAVNAEGAAGTTGDPSAAAEIQLAQWESVATNIQPVLASFSFFGLGARSPQGTTDTPFCEDFNEYKVCGVTGTNTNGCVNNNSVTGIPGETGANPATAPTQSTICGDGVVEAFEECDWNGNVQGGTGGCSATCRCNLDWNDSAGSCN